LLRLVILLITTIYFRLDRGVVHIFVAGHIVYHYCLMFDRGVVHIVVAVLLLNITD
jgi:hypothetical protein